MIIWSGCALFRHPMKTKKKQVQDIEISSPSIKQLWIDVVSDVWDEIEEQVKNKELKDSKEAICEHIILEYLQGAVDKMRSLEDDALFMLRETYAPDEE